MLELVICSAYMAVELFEETLSGCLVVRFLRSPSRSKASAPKPPCNVKGNKDLNSYST